MGNHLACISIQSCHVVAAKQSNLIVVVHSAESRVLEFSGQSMQVAELMLEFPGFFITELKLERTTQVSINRAVPMSADQQLMSISSKKSGVAYALLPMNRTQKPVAAQEWTTWTQMVIKHFSVPEIIKKQSKSRNRASNRVAPLQDAQDDIVVEEAEVHSNHEEEEEEDIIEQVKQELSSISSSYCRRHWAPKLQTIIEL